MFTRKEYLSSSAPDKFERFYSQLVNGNFIGVANSIAELINKRESSIDVHLNEWETLGYWDDCSKNIWVDLKIYNVLYERPETELRVYLSDKLCVLKHCVRESLEKKGWKKVEERLIKPVS